MGAKLHEFSKRILDITLMNRIFKYSAIKNTANIVPEYSTLKPETNSDSPSEKSNGVRLVSANETVNQISDIGIDSCQFMVGWVPLQKVVKSRVVLIIAKKIKVRIIGIS